MRILGRDSKRVIGALRRGNHYRAMARSLRIFVNPVAAEWRYLSGRGRYPTRLELRTPVGRATARLWHPEDMLTVNEIFCRQDYGPGGQRVIVDIGANIGLSALYFLTRRPDCRVYAFEPVPSNLERLRENLESFGDRLILDTRAVGDQTGTVDFLVEPTGRLGGFVRFSTRGGEVVQVDCVDVADVLRTVLSVEGRIDLVKIDTEGSERLILDAIPQEIRSQIGAVVWENNDGTTCWA